MHQSEENAVDTCKNMYMYIILYTLTPLMLNMVMYGYFGHCPHRRCIDIMSLECLEALYSLADDDTVGSELNCALFQYKDPDFIVHGFSSFIIHFIDL